MITHKSVEKVIYLHSISINHANLLIISITANTFGQKTHSSIFQATYMAVWLEKRPFSMAGSREEAWDLQGSRFKEGRRGTTQETQWENARTSMENARSPWEKTRSPSLAFAMEGLSEEGGDLLSRIAVQYHRRARA